jgi:hypothetical protein
LPLRLLSRLLASASLHWAAVAAAGPLPLPQLLESAPAAAAHSAASAATACCACGSTIASCAGTVTSVMTLTYSEGMRQFPCPRRSSAASLCSAAAVVTLARKSYAYLAVPDCVIHYAGLCLQVECRHQQLAIGQPAIMLQPSLPSQAYEQGSASIGHNGFCSPALVVESPPQHGLSSIVASAILKCHACQKNFDITLLCT